LAKDMAKEKREGNNGSKKNGATSSVKAGMVKKRKSQKAKDKRNDHLF